MTATTTKPPILLLSQPAGGKTSGLRHLRPELGKRTLIINADSKAMPWVDAPGEKNEFTFFEAKCPTLLPSIIKQAVASSKFDLIVVDTITVAMTEYTRRFINTTMPKYVKDDQGAIISDTNYIAVSEKHGGKVDGMGGWGRYGALVSDIVAESTKGMEAGVQMVIMGHLNCKEDENNEFVYKCPLQGQVGKQGLEGLFSIVMHAMSKPLDKLQGELAQDHQWLGTEESIEFTGERFVYQVAHTQDTIHSHALRTIDGLWPKGVRFIDNNLQMVFDRFEEVYKK